MRINNLELQTKQFLPIREGVISGKLGNDHVSIYGYTRRISGDTHLNERLEYCKAAVYRHDGQFQYLVATITDRRKVARLFDFDGYSSDCHERYTDRTCEVERERLPIAASFHEINFSPFATNILDHVGSTHLATAGGEKVKIEQSMCGEFVVSIGAESFPRLSNLEASRLLNQRRAGILK
jgi:hypothetical protein